MSDIDAMPAGHEMDALVAKALGIPLRGMIYTDPPAHMLESGRAWQPSTNIADAWVVVERLRSLGHTPIVYFVRGAWCCLLMQGNPYIGVGSLDVDSLGAPGCATAETAPLAICRAALEVVKHD